MLAQPVSLCGQPYSDSLNSPRPQCSLYGSISFPHSEAHTTTSLLIGMLSLISKPRTDCLSLSLAPSASFYPSPHWANTLCPSQPQPEASTHSAASQKFLFL